MELLNIKKGYLSRNMNEGFLGKKRNKFQMAMLELTPSILDETDSGLDIDALKTVANGVNKLKTRQCNSRYYSLSKAVRSYRSRFCPCII